MPSVRTLSNASLVFRGKMCFSNVASCTTVADSKRRFGLSSSVDLPWAQSKKPTHACSPLSIALPLLSKFSIYGIERGKLREQEGEYFSAGPLVFQDCR